MDDTDNISRITFCSTLLLFKDKWDIRKDFGVLCISVFMIHIPYFVFYYVQSSLNSNHNLGDVTLAVTYLFQVVSSFFVPVVVIRHLGSKWALVIAMTTITAFFCANFYPVFYTFIVFGALMGIGLGILWSVVGTYVSTFAFKYAKITGAKAEHVLAKFFGFFFMALKAAGIMAGGIAHALLPHTQADDNTTIPEYCGLNYCHEKVGLQAEDTVNASYVNQRIEEENILWGVLIGICISSIIFILIFLHNIKQQPKTFGVKLLLETVHLLKRKEQSLLFIVGICLGTLQSFSAAEFNKGYVTCILGLRYTGFSLLVFGVGITLGSAISGMLSQSFGRLIVFTGGAICYAAYLIVLLVWTPAADQHWLFLLLSFIYGVAEATYLTQITAAYGVFFPDDKEAAFANFSVSQCLGIVMGFISAPVLCIGLKVKLLLGFLVLSFLTFFYLEFLLPKGDGPVQSFFPLQDSPAVIPKLQSAAESIINCAEKENLSMTQIKSNSTLTT